MYDCPQCGHPTGTLNEGVCEPCRKENQQQLDAHNADYDAWQRMAESQRDEAIRRAGK